MTKRDVMPPARDGETLSDERAVDRFIREVLSGDTYATVTENALVLEVAALRAELADARADKERLDWLEKWLPKQPGHRRLVFDRSVPEFTLFQSDDNVRRLGMKKTLRAAIDAARAASGEDTSHHE